MRRASKYAPASNTPLLGKLIDKPASLRSPEEVEADLRRDDRNHARIAAAIDFLQNVEDDVLQRQIQHALHTKP